VPVPRLTIAIPTHHGRAQLLSELLADLVTQCDGRVDVAVCDNASSDGTATVVAAARARGLALSYHRHAENLGAAANIAAVVERAGGDFCWLVSSDDRLPAGAVARVLELLDAHPEAAGLTVHQCVMDRAMAWTAEAQATATVPPLDTITVLRGAPDVTRRLGWIMSGLSSQVVRRDAWLADAAQITPTQLYPHVAVMLAMAGRGRPWVWCPEKLVHVRAGNAALPISGERWESWLLTELDRHWRGAAGDAAALREIRDRYLDAAERRARLPRPYGAEPPVRDDVALLVALARVLWSHPRFWRQTALRLTARALTARGRTARRLRPAPKAMPPLVDADRRTRLVADLPATMVHADEHWIRAALHIEGTVPYRSTGPHAVHIVSRWRRPGTETWHEGGRTVLGRPLRPGRTHRLDIRIVAPWEPGLWELQLTTVQEGIAWFADEDPAGGTARIVEIETLA
jgi:glycosyltransferase involved in cell wall biosynthesis